MDFSKKFETAPECWINTRIWPCSGTDRKPMLVLLHYWGGSTETWHRLTDRDSPTSLSAVYPTVAIDLRGWGESSDQPSSIENSFQPFSIKSMASDVSMILQKMRSDADTKDMFDHGFVLVGHSMGAKVALTTANDLNQLLPELKGFVLIAPAPVTPMILPREIIELRQTAYDCEASVRGAMAHDLAQKGMLSPSDADLVVRGSLRGHPLAKKSWPAYAMQEDVSEAVRGALGQVRHGNSPLKAVVIYGENDPVEPQERVMGEVVPFLEKCGVEIVSACGARNVKHLIPLESPEVIYDQICRRF
ncbi:Alpha/Beta hydrolase protein [Penicillium pulvis]|uniref:Alpha/Beta hydrolase protein n=1 Tax=Penicillium pulvis TaxID=1562058 RepID=UPI0025495228|nr:Alpha/Beta hydrolase protein [Penicillium pulvis]KAJ5797623.1 Alpha/Beta hydrolase protein [Penicillium pulvis]